MYKYQKKSNIESKSIIDGYIVSEISESTINTPHEELSLDFIIKLAEKGTSSTECKYSSNEELVDFIYNSFIYDDINIESTPNTKFLIDKIAHSIGVDKVDYALLNILSKNIYTSTEDEIIKFVILLSCLDRDLIPITCLTAVTGLSNHKFDSVKESVLEMIESWEWKGAIPHLEAMDDFKRPHLQKYKMEILEYLKGLH